MITGITAVAPLRVTQWSLRSTHGGWRTPASATVFRSAATSVNRGSMFTSDCVRRDAITFAPAYYSGGSYCSLRFFHSCFRRFRPVVDVNQFHHGVSGCLFTVMALQGNPTPPACLTVKLAVPWVLTSTGSFLALRHTSSCTHIIRELQSYARAVA